MLCNGKPVPQGFSYNSGRNPDFLTVEDLKSLIAGHLEKHATE